MIAWLHHKSYIFIHYSCMWMTFKKNWSRVPVASSFWFLRHLSPSFVIWGAGSESMFLNHQAQQNKSKGVFIMIYPPKSIHNILQLVLLCNNIVTGQEWNLSTAASEDQDECLYPERLLRRIIIFVCLPSLFLWCYTVNACDKFQQSRVASKITCLWL